MFNVPTIDSDLIEAGRELTRLGFTQAAVRARFGLPEGDDSLVPMQRPLLDFRKPPDEEPVLDLLIQLFIVGCGVRYARARALLSTATLATLERDGIVTRHDDTLVSTIAIVPFRDLLVASDRLDAMYDPEYVLYLNPTVSFVLPFIPPVDAEPTGHALDVGCGCGVLAMLAAAYYRRVIAVDINPRAVAFTAFNAALNGLSSVIEARVCEPSALRDRAFHDMDLVLFNIPTMYQAHFISRSVAFRSEMGEGLLVDAYVAAASMLAPGGRCVYTHQARTTPDRYFEELLARHGCAEALSITWLSGGALTPIGYQGLEWGVALARRRENGAPFFRRVPARESLGHLDREEVARFISSQELVVAGDHAGLVPYFAGEELELVESSRVREGTLVPGATRARGETVSSDELAVLHVVDGRSTIATLAARLGRAPSACADVVGALVARRLLHVRR